MRGKAASVAIEIEEGSTTQTMAASVRCVTRRHNGCGSDGGSDDGSECNRAGAAAESQQCSGNAAAMQRQCSGNAAAAVGRRQAKLCGIKDVCSATRVENMRNQHELSPQLDGILEIQILDAGDDDAR